MSDLDSEAPADLEGLILERLLELARARDPIPPDVIDRLYALVAPPAGRIPEAGGERSG